MNATARGRKRKPGLQIEWCHDVPSGVRKLAERRTRDMLAHYGRNITSMPIETLVASCYLQGVNDCFEFQEKRAEKAQNNEVSDASSDH